MCQVPGETYIKCTEDKFYTKNDIFIDANLSFVVNSFYYSTYKGIVHSLEFDKGMVNYDIMHTVDISLNNNLSYDVFIMDQKAQIFSSSPSIIPRGRIRMLHGLNGTTTEVYLKVKLIIENNF